MGNCFSKRECGCCHVVILENNNTTPTRANEPAASTSASHNEQATSASASAPTHTDESVAVASSESAVPTRADEPDAAPSPSTTRASKKPAASSASDNDPRGGILDLNTLDFPQVIDVLISARFDGGLTEKQARELNAELRKGGINSYIVYSEAGSDFGILTMP